MDKRQKCNPVHKYKSTDCNERAAKIQKVLLCAAGGVYKSPLIVIRFKANRSALLLANNFNLLILKHYTVSGEKFFAFLQFG